MSSGILRVLKLVSGDEIIGVVHDGADEPVEDDRYSLDNLLFVTNPMKIIADYNAVSKVHSLYLVDWVPSIKDSTLPIDKNKVVTLGNANSELERHYTDIILAEGLHDHFHSQKEDLHEAEVNDSTEDDDDKSDELTNKLKKHKFDDDDIQ